TGQQEQFQVAEGGNPGEVHHGLAEVVLAVGIFHQVDLVDDVDQVNGFGDAPEHLVDPGPQLPVPFDAVPVEFADISVGALAVVLVPAQDGGEGEAVAVGEAVVELRFGGQGQVVPREVVAIRRLVKVAVLDAHIAANIEGDGGRGHQGGQQRQGRQDGVVHHSADAAQGVDVEIPLRKTHPEPVVAVGQHGAVLGLVVDHLEAHGAPVAVEKL